MRIGYPCINRSLACRCTHGFRLASYSPQRLEEAVLANLDGLQRILEFNASRGILFFRISSDLVPFASHPVMSVPWQERFRGHFGRIGRYIRKHAIRVNMHPDQFTLINSPDEKIFARSREELLYHARVLDLLGLDQTNKIQIHVGGVYGDKDSAIARFVARYRSLPELIRRRLVVENDHVSYSLEDCLRVHRESGIPVVLDVLHQMVLCGPFDPKKALAGAAATWKDADGIPFVDYSLQAEKGLRGAHAESIRLPEFRRFLSLTRPIDFDVMLEIKDKERSAAKAVAAAENDKRFFRPAVSSGCIPRGRACNPRA